MRLCRWSLVILALLVGGPAACAAADEPRAAPPSASPAASASSVGPTPSPTPVPPSPSPSTPAGRPTPRHSSPVTAIPTWRPSPRPMGPTLTGVVERDGACTILVAGRERYVINGDVAETLAVGAKVSVTTNAAALPPGCPDRPDLPALLVVRAAPA